MADDAQQSHISQLEHAVTTVLACLSMVKYNAVLGEEQKRELISDIEATVQFLRSSLVANAAQPQGGLLQSPRTGGLSKPRMVSDGAAQYEDDSQKSEHRKLYALYHVYHTYLNLEQGNMLGTFVGRFNEVMTTIDEVQNLVERSRGSGNYDIYDIYPRYTSIEDPLHRVRGFIGDLYYTFVEFMRALSEILQENDAHLDTEELSSLPKPRANNTSIQNAYEPQALVSLAYAYDAHQRLNAGTAAVTRHLNDAITFLEFLEENLDSNFNKRNEVVAQMQKIVQLLDDISHLLMSYESAASVLLGRAP
jgi:hypothetical protein